MSEFNNLFRSIKADLIQERGGSTESPEVAIQVFDDEPPPKTSYSPTLLLLLFFSLSINVGLGFAITDIVVMYSSPEHTLWKVRTSPDNHHLPKDFVSKAREEVCR
jgi:hypothetical protein